ncbi:MAG: cytochrome C [Gammaproteobacteria bacterium]|nr:cytochrome C [Gammaproteobacteria bacterium]
MNKNTKIALTLLAVMGLAGIFLTGVALHPALATTDFCVSCHEMEAPLAEYQQSAHFSSASGVRAECSSCHVTEGFGPTLYDKIDALRHVYGHFTSSIDTDEKYEASRLRMAERVWADMKEHDSRECRSCHNQEGFEFDKFQSHSSAKRMSKGLDDGKTCIDCHKGLVHTMPDMTSGYKAIQNELITASTDPDIETGIVFPLETVIGYPKKEGNRESRILGGTRLTVLDNEGKWLKVRVDGWKQDGVDAMIYELQGKRIFSVALDISARNKSTIHSTMFDEDTEQTWHKVSYEAWVSNQGLIEDETKLWEYGEKLHSGNCGSCHMAVPANHFLANQWIGVMKDMKRNIRHLSKEQYRFLQKYLQLNAKDVKETSH